MTHAWILPNFICPKCHIEMIVIGTETGSCSPNGRVTLWCDTPDCEEFSRRYVAWLHRQEVDPESP